jgi:hypothetical protein
VGGGHVVSCSWMTVAVEEFAANSIVTDKASLRFEKKTTNCQSLVQMNIHITAYVHSTVSCFNSRNSRLFCLQLLCATHYHTPVPFRNSLTNRDLSHTSWNEVKELRSQRYLFLSHSGFRSYCSILERNILSYGQRTRYR